jgi:hypothetical protein
MMKVNSQKKEKEMVKIKFPLTEDQKQKLRDRLEEVLSRKDGEQIIILCDKDKLTDYYQNICLKHLLIRIIESAKEYAKLTNNQLIKDNLKSNIRDIRWKPKR